MPSKRKVRRGRFKSATVSVKKFSQPRRAGTYTVKRAKYKLKKSVSIKKNQQSVTREKLQKLIKPASQKFFKKYSKGSKRIYYARITMKVQRGKQKFKSGFALFTEKIDNKKDFDKYIDNLIAQASEKFETYLGRRVKISVDGFSLQVEGKYAKSKSKTARKQKSGKSKNQRVRHRKR